MDEAELGDIKTRRSSSRTGLVSASSVVFHLPTTPATAARAREGGVERGKDGGRRGDWR